MVGAYASKGSIESSFRFEFLENLNEVCAEQIRTGDTSYSSTIPARVGLLWDNTAVRKKWKSDVFASRQTGKRTLKRHRGEAKPGGFITHTEVWVKPRKIKGIVIRKKISDYILKEVCKAVLLYKVPLYRLNKDWTLSEMELVLKK